MVKYLDTFRKRLGLKVQFGTEIGHIQALPGDSLGDYRFSMQDQKGTVYRCK